MILGAILCVIIWSMALCCIFKVNINFKRKNLKFEIETQEK